MATRAALGPTRGGGRGRAPKRFLIAGVACEAWDDMSGVTRRGILAAVALTIVGLTAVGLPTSAEGASACFGGTAWAGVSAKVGTAPYDGPNGPDFQDDDPGCVPDDPGVSGSRCFTGINLHQPGGDTFIGVMVVDGANCIQEEP